MLHRGGDNREQKRIPLRESPPAGALKWVTPLSIAKIRPIIGHNLETAQDRRLVAINH